MSKLHNFPHVLVQFKKIIKKRFPIKSFRNQHKNYWSLWSSKGVEYIKESWWQKGTAKSGNPSLDVKLCDCKKY